MTQSREQEVRRVFTITLWLKAVQSFFELVAGVLVFFLSADTIFRIAGMLTQKELLEDPHDIVANALFHAASSWSVGAQDFVALYLMSHGAIKLLFVSAILTKKKWAYPAFMASLLLFMLYQLYRFTATHSIMLIVLTLFDAGVLLLTLHEYRIRVRQ